MERELNPKNVFTESEVKTILSYKECFNVQIDGNPSEIAHSEYNKIFYVVYGGQLRQMRILKSIVFPFTRRYENIRNIALIEIAGIGKMYVNSSMYYYSFPFNIYESVRDFTEDKKYELKGACLYCFYKSIKEVITKRNRIDDIYMRICDFSYYGKSVCYKWNGTSVDIVDVKIPLYFTYSPKEGYVIPMDEEDFPEVISDGKLYTSKSLCEEENQIKVCCFDDELEKEKEETRYDINIFGVPMTATREELSDIRKQINQILL